MTRVIDALRLRVLSGPTGPQVGAFFDFDGTLIDGRSALAFYRDRLRQGEMDPIELARTMMLGFRGVTTETEFAEVLSLSLAGWAGRSKDELEQLGERLFRRDLAHLVFPESWQIVLAHRQQGHTVVITSSATRFQVLPLAREMGIENILCTEVESEDDILTGRPLGNVPFGEGKAQAVRDFISENELDVDASYAYSNGTEDVPLLQSVGRPQAVNPDPAPRRAAETAGWPVLDFTTGGKAVRAVRTVATYSGMISGIGAGISLGLLNRNRRQAVDLSLALAGDVGAALAGLQINIQGEEHVWSHRPAVFLINHQSSIVDALVVIKLLRSGFTAVAKKEAAHMPVFGPFLRFADCAFVERGRPEHAQEAMAPAVEKLRSGISLVIAPEGTRSYTPKLGPFKKGAFHVAAQAHVPIVPIVIRNAGQFMPRGARTIRPGTVDIVVHPPIEITDWKVEDFDEHVAGVRQIYLDTLGQFADKSPTDSATTSTRTQAVHGKRAGAAAASRETRREMLRP